MRGSKDAGRGDQRRSTGILCHQVRPLHFPSSHLRLTTRVVLSLLVWLSVCVSAMGQDLSDIPRPVMQEYQRVETAARAIWKALGFPERELSFEYVRWGRGTKVKNGDHSGGRIRVNVDQPLTNVHNAFHEMWHAVQSKLEGRVSYERSYWRWDNQNLNPYEAEAAMVSERLKRLFRSHSENFYYTPEKFAAAARKELLRLTPKLQKQWRTAKLTHETVRRFETLNGHLEQWSRRESYVRRQRIKSVGKDLATFGLSFLVKSGLDSAFQKDSMLFGDRLHEFATFRGAGSVVLFTGASAVTSYWTRNWKHGRAGVPLMVASAATDIANGWLKWDLHSLRDFSVTSGSTLLSTGIVGGFSDRLLFEKWIGRAAPSGILYKTIKYVTTMYMAERMVHVAGGRFKTRGIVHRPVHAAN